MKTRVASVLVRWAVMVPIWGAAASLEAAPLEGFARVAESDHFTHFAREKAKTDVGRREQQVVRVEKLLDVKLGRRVEYYAYTRPEEIQAVTGHYVAGYFYPSLGQVHATPDAEAHEIVHLVAHELGDPGPFFHEGLAVALGNRGRMGGWPIDRVARTLLHRLAPEALEARFASLQSSWEAVAAAGSFVTWLSDKHGVSKVSAFFRACGRTGRPVAFEATFGLPLGEALRGWAGSLGVRPSPEEPPTLIARAEPASALSLPVAEYPAADAAPRPAR